MFMTITMMMMTMMNTRIRWINNVIAVMFIVTFINVIVYVNLSKINLNFSLNLCVCVCVLCVLWILWFKYHPEKNSMTSISDYDKYIPERLPSTQCQLKSLTGWAWAAIQNDLLSITLFKSPLMNCWNTFATLSSVMIGRLAFLLSQNFFASSQLNTEPSV